AVSRPTNGRKRMMAIQCPGNSTTGVFQLFPDWACQITQNVSKLIQPANAVY
ncbi:MAG: hypothetical protein ACI8UO_001833, partial [Verrucomicrobiales bacterium]